MQEVWVRPPGWGTKIPSVAQQSKKIKKKKHLWEEQGSLHLGLSNWENTEASEVLKKKKALHRWEGNRVFS